MNTKQPVAVNATLGCSSLQRRARDEPAASKISRLLCGLAGIALLAGCSRSPDLPTGAAAYALIPPATGATVLREYRLQPFDRISVTVYREPDLSLSEVEVDASGSFGLPLLGPVKAAGLTTQELAAGIQSQLEGRYVNDPHVSINVTSAALRRVTIDGSVKQPGVYEIRGQTTLIGAISMAHGPTPVAALSEVAVLRMVDGELMGAKFNLSAIRRGEAPDPEILPNDTVVVGFSTLKSGWRDFLQAVPAGTLFYRLSQ